MNPHRCGSGCRGGGREAKPSRLQQAGHGQGERGEYCEYNAGCVLCVLCGVWWCAMHAAICRKNCVIKGPDAALEKQDLLGTYPGFFEHLPAWNMKVRRYRIVRTEFQSGLNFTDLYESMMSAVHSACCDDMFLNLHGTFASNRLWTQHFSAHWRYSTFGAVWRKRGKAASARPEHRWLKHRWQVSRDLYSFAVDAPRPDRKLRTD